MKFNEPRRRKLLLLAIASSMSIALCCGSGSWADHNKALLDSAPISAIAAAPASHDTGSTVIEATQIVRELI